MHACPSGQHVSHSVLLGEEVMQPIYELFLSYHYDLPFIGSGEAEAERYTPLRTSMQTTTPTRTGFVRAAALMYVAGVRLYV